jgi:hypothetical protein
MNGGAQGQPTVLSIHKNKKQKGSDIVPFGPPPMGGPPMYFARVSSSKRPNIKLYKGGEQEVFTSSDHSFSSAIDLMVHGQPMQMRQSSMSGACTIQHPTLGDLKWKVPQLIGTTADLSDSRGTKIAALKSNKVKGMGQKIIELYVPCDPSFLDLVVGSAFALMKANKELAEGAMEIAGAGLEVALAGA